MAIEYSYLNFVKWHYKTFGIRDIDRANRDNTYKGLAAKRGHLDIIKWIIEIEGSEWLEQHPANGSASAIQLLIEKGHIEILNWLVENQYYQFSEHDLLYAINKGSQRIVSYLIEQHDFSLDIKDKYGHSPVLMAVDGGHFELLQWLLEKQGMESLNSKNNRRKDAMDFPLCQHSCRL